ncbi:CPBP family glutamic-type intramembrane protease [Saccharopolyspora sp. WRP15-2]|uniref:CPBP family glutamic-type intramembrane protease n=1 Tax=Saccharopolyspora oryzae TaxID=2997343 RepID=A0ABT4UTU0_9PSEU|nr:CPBP family glutamic-type intramembrane protease [Saccharopolyspora oryzae]MDA3624482.1 CPBP family glutamic-type intramembrane protease [Saccharopolyspora oryzae]
MSTAQSDQGLPSALLGGIGRARRPSGPVVGLVVVVVCLVIGQTAGALVLAPVFGVPIGALARGRAYLAAQLAMLFSFLGVVGMLALWIRIKERRPFGSVGFFPASRVGAHLGIGAAVAVVLLGVPVGVNLLSGQFDIGAVHVAQVGGAFIALIGFAVQASTEEVITRGYLMQVTYRKWGLAAAVVLQAVVFSLLHGINPNVSAVALINILLIALLLAFWALAEGSLWGVCAFHAVWNWLQGNVYGIEVSGMGVQTTMLSIGGSPGSAELLTGGGFGIEASLLTTAVLAIGTALAYFAYRRRARSATR